MKFQCAYCPAVYERTRRPKRCPECKRKYSITVTENTPLKDIVRAVDKNGYTLDVDLKPIPASFELAIASLPEEEK